jgi:uncharacterized protein YciI
MRVAQYCYLLKPCRPSLPFDATPAERETIGAHFAYLKGLFATGTVRFVGRTEAGEFGITVYEAASDEQADAIMRDDPVIQSGVMTATVYPFRIALSPGMEV